MAAVLKTISVSSISKGQGNSSPEVTRCIGVASVVYSIWSSLRFRQLTPWHLQICPPPLFGGLPGRSAQQSELSFSHELMEDPDAHLSIFVDRWKCFDLVIPELALDIAADLGMSPQVVVAAKGNYRDQSKFFKLGPFDGDSVMCSNSAVQACSLSIIMVNAMFAILTHHLQTVSPNVSLSSFIDDCKLWISQREHLQLQQAFSELQLFDQAVGQVHNSGKTYVLSRTKKRALRFLRDIKQPFHCKQGVRSLGFSHKAPKVPSAKLQTAKVDKAVAVIRKIVKLPVSERDKVLHIHVNAHSRWLFGTEVQPPSLHDFKRLRTCVVNALTK